MIWDDLAVQGWGFQENFIPSEEWMALGTSLETNHGLQSAHIGRGATKLKASAIRGDSIRWLEKNSGHPLQQIAWDHLESLRQSLNENLFLGLKWFEAHFALYPPGAGYDLHLDQHIGQSGRRITFILYLNENWTSSDGGALELHTEKGHEIIAPLGGRLVLFRSEFFPHRVQPTARPRKSLTGWFRDDAPF